MRILTYGSDMSIPNLEVIYKSAYSQSDMSLPQREFVKLIRDRLALTQTDLGREMGKDNAYQAAHAWEIEGVRLRYTETMEMLSLAGLLQPEAEAAWRGISLADASLDVGARLAVIRQREAAARLGADEQHPQDGMQSA